MMVLIFINFCIVLHLFIFILIVLIKLNPVLKGFIWSVSSLGAFCRFKRFLMQGLSLNSVVTMTDSEIFRSYLIKRNINWAVSR